MNTQYKQKQLTWDINNHIITRYKNIKYDINNHINSRYKKEINSHIYIYIYIQQHSIVNAIDAPTKNQHGVLSISVQMCVKNTKKYIGANKKEINSHVYVQQHSIVNAIDAPIVVTCIYVVVNILCITCIYVVVNVAFYVFLTCNYVVVNVSC